MKESLEVKRGIYPNIVVIKNRYYVIVIQDYQIDELVEKLQDMKG